MSFIAAGIRQVDTRLGGWEHVTASFLVEGPRPALIEAGAQTSASTVRDALATCGLGPDDLAWLVVTHIHLDHAGGIGDLAEAFPRATVVVHEKGARHLVDPTRLIASAARVYGPLLDTLYGRLHPVAEERVIAASDGFHIDIGNGRTLTLVDSPGHAQHHHAVLDEQTGTLMVGDAVGVRLPDTPELWPATPPPDFNLELASSSLQRFIHLNPTAVALTHYGLLPDPLPALHDADAALHRWVEVARPVAEHAASSDAAVDDIAAAFSATFLPSLNAVPGDVREQLQTLNGIRSNAAGIARYLEHQH